MDLFEKIYYEESTNLTKYIKKYMFEEYLDIVVNDQKSRYTYEAFKVPIEIKTEGGFGLLPNKKNYNNIQQGNSRGLIGKIIDFIKNTVSKIINGFKQMFGLKGDNIFDLKEFTNSKEFNVMVNSNYDARMKEINRQMSIGDKLINTISRVPGLDEDKVRKFTSTVSSLVHSIPKPVAVFGAVAGTLAGGTLLAKNHVEKLKKDMDAEIDNHLKTYNRNIAYIFKGEDKKAKARDEVLASMSTLTKLQINMYSSLMSAIKTGMLKLKDSRQKVVDTVKNKLSSKSKNAKNKK